MFLEVWCSLRGIHQLVPARDSPARRAAPEWFWICGAFFQRHEPHGREQDVADFGIPRSGDWEAGPRQGGRSWCVFRRVSEPGAENHWDRRRDQDASRRSRWRLLFWVYRW